MLAGIVPLDSGRVEVGGRAVALLELGAGFGRDFSGRENIMLNGALHGLTREQIEARIDDIVAFSELGHFIDVPVRAYSSGMFVRLGFAIAVHMDADVLLIDEVLAVGDEAFQRKCETRIAERIAAGATLVLVSHDAALIAARARAPWSSTAARSSSTAPRARGCPSTIASWVPMRPEEALERARSASFGEDLAGSRRADRRAEHRATHRVGGHRDRSEARAVHARLGRADHVVQARAAARPAPGAGPGLRAAVAVQPDGPRPTAAAGEPA